MKIQNLSVCAYVFFILTKKCCANVLGCGGFIKSHAPIDFAKIEVKLYTKQGTLKDSTFCAPNNGYYFLPLYDKGEYNLQINPPTGWSFMPKEVYLKIDGTTDLCSQGKDINFIFEGFGITGQVDNVGGGPGPKGVKIQLTGNSEVRETVTTDEGTFYFTPVYPGIYIVKATHPKWKFKNDVITVQVASENTELPKNSLLIFGYDVSGSIIFDRQPIANINLIVFNNLNQPVLFDNCANDVPFNLAYGEKYLCYVNSNENGLFTFPSLSPGFYKLVPFYEKDNVKYHIHPEDIDFRVVRDSVIFPQPFEVQSFSVTGQVLTHIGGDSVQGATIFVNDKPVTTTQDNGLFLLKKLSAGTYNILIEAPGLKFDTKSIKIYPNVELDSIFIPSAFQICGNVASEHSHTVVFSKIESTDSSRIDYKVETHQGTGDFCIYLPNGNYTTYVLKSHLKSDSIQFFPVSQMIQVESSPTTDIKFTQLKAVVKGELKCLQPNDCSQISVIMRHLSHDGKVQGKEYVTNLIDGKYQFVNVIPGSYQMSLGLNKFCWEISKQVITVNSETTLVPDFIQIGYTVLFLSSHNSQIEYEPLVQSENEKSTKTLDIIPGQNIHCVENAGVYEFIINSCHLYENSRIKYDTNTEASEIVLAATKHKITIEITSSIQDDNMNVSVTIGSTTNLVGPIIPTFIDNLYYYKINLYLAEKEEAVLVPHSHILWFKPTAYTIIGSDDCVDHGARILGLKGKVIQGQLLPPLAGVKITVTGSQNEVLIRETDTDGKFKFPALDDTNTYKITATKDSYVFTGPDEDGNFKAHKLAQINVKVVDKKDESPLQGALISLSGGESYRSNLQTNVNGTIIFNGLGPSDYFLRPMMKEYNFEPNSKIISIEEGATVDIKLSGQRVAYSAYGIVTSLSGEPEDKMVVVADGTGSCSQYSEEATTEENGQFRIRGLHPQCLYELRVKESLDPSQNIERAIPEMVKLQTSNEDIHGIKLIALRHVQHMDIIVRVLSPKLEYFRSLRLKLSRESAPNSPIYNVKLDPVLYKSASDIHPGVLVHLPPLPIDYKSYYIQLDSTLSQSIHYYKRDIEYFVANVSFKYFALEFSPQSQIPDQDIGHTSVLALPFILLCMVAFYYLPQLSKIITDLLGKYNFNMIANLFIKSNSSVTDRITDTDEIDQIVQNINAVKRKVKPRKA